MSDKNKRKDDQGRFHNLKILRPIDKVVSVAIDLDNPGRGECAFKRKYCTSK